MDTKLGGYLAAIAYDDTDEKIYSDVAKIGEAVAPEEFASYWRVFPAGRVGYPAKGQQGSFTVFVNEQTKEIVFAFKGSNTFGEWVDDLLKAAEIP
ncbi:MAG: hypothetical protein ABI612_08705 [Betaproteobacteria bacterium]